MDLSGDPGVRAVEGCVLVTVDRPQARNAINDGVVVRLRQAREKLASDDGSDQARFPTIQGTTHEL